MIINGLFTGWMLLSYRKAATASSTMAEFAADRVTDEDPRTFWVAAQNKAGETLTVDLGAQKTVRALQVNYADYKSGRFADAPGHLHRVRAAAFDSTARAGSRWPSRTGRAATGPMPISSCRSRSARGSSATSTAMSARANLAISDLRVFGNADGRAPAAPGSVVGQRHQDQRDATIRWAKVPGAVGYNIRFGTRADRLTHTYQLWADELGNGATLQKELRSLNDGVPYWVAVEAFNETGVSKLSRTLPIR